MKKISMAVLLSLTSITGAALAQSGPTSDVRESTDPSKIAAVEQHARELASSSQQNVQSDTDRGNKRSSNRQGSRKMARSHRQHDTSSGASRTGESSAGRPAGQ
jgi:hypothetical protein